MQFYGLKKDKKDTGVSVKRRRVPGTLDKVRTKTEIMTRPSPWSKSKIWSGSNAPQVLPFSVGCSGRQKYFFDKDI